MTRSITTRRATSRPGRRTGTAIIAATPPLGLGYVRVRVDEGPASLVTHQAGVTFLQTLIEGLTVGASLKYVRGEASFEPGSGAGPRPGNAFDMDAGVLLVRRRGVSGLLQRTSSSLSSRRTAASRWNCSAWCEPGIAWLEGDWTASVDVDLTKSAMSPDPSAAEIAASWPPERSGGGDAGWPPEAASGSTRPATCRPPWPPPASGSPSGAPSGWMPTQRPEVTPPTRDGAWRDACTSR